MIQCLLLLQLIKENLVLTYVTDITLERFRTRSLHFICPFPESVYSEFAVFMTLLVISGYISTTNKPSAAHIVCACLMLFLDMPSQVLFVAVAPFTGITANPYTVHTLSIIFLSESRMICKFSSLCKACLLFQLSRTSTAFVKW